MKHSLRLLLLSGLLSFFSLHISVAQPLSVPGTVTNIHCHGDSTGSIVYQINGGPGPIHYVWNTGDSGISTGGCTYIVNINNPGAAIDSFQVQVNVTLAAGMNGNFDNVSFNDTSNNRLPFWLQDFPGPTTATFWVLVPSVPAGASYIYMTFCSPAPVNGTPDSVFDFFDNFDHNTFPLWAQSCPRSGSGAVCSFATDNSIYFSPGYSAHLTGVSTCFGPLYAGCLAVLDRVASPMANDSFVIDYDDRVQVNLQGYCIGATSSQTEVAAAGVQLGVGQSRSQSGTCGIQTSGWLGETSSPFAVNTGSVDISLELYGGDCDNSDGWFDNVRIRKYRTYPPVATVDTTPTLVLNHLAAGTYTITLTAANGYDSVATFIVGGPAALAPVLDFTNVTCNGAANGTAWIVPGTTGGTPRVNYPAYSYAWSGTVQTTDTITGLAPGLYTVTVTDSLNCTATAQVNIIQPPNPLSLVMDSLNIPCLGQTNGMTWVTASGGTAGYTYSWSSSPVQTTDTATSLPPGNYSVTVTDTNHCTAGGSVNVIQPPSAISLTTDSVNVLCHGLSTGQAGVIASGGTPGYTYLWSNTQTTDTITAIPAALYTVTVTDIQHCTATVTVNVSQPPAALTLVIDSVNMTCQNLADGQVTAVPSGGTPGYTYLWNTTATTDTMSHLGAGLYMVTITDANNCTLAGQVNLAPSTDTVVIDSSVTAATCGLSNGSVTVNPSGGSGGYAYVWSTTSTSQTVSGLSGGTYMVTVTDANLCSSTRSVSIPQFPALQFTVTTQDDTCALGKGVATISVTSGTPPYVNTWIPAGANPTALDSNTYILTTTDSVGCTQADTFSIGNIGIKPNPSFGTADTSLCPGSTIILTPGSAFATYQWQDATSLPQYSVTAAGVYSVTVTNSFGCRNSASITVIDHCRSSIIFPTAFSPNGDGKNDVFRPVYSADLNTFHMRIYDRWGELVFETFDFIHGWDGTYKNIAQPMGTYIWFIEYSYTSQAVLTQTGNITLLR